MSSFSSIAGAGALQHAVQALFSGWLLETGRVHRLSDLMRPQQQLGVIGAAVNAAPPQQAQSQQHQPRQPQNSTTSSITSSGGAGGASVGGGGAAGGRHQR